MAAYKPLPPELLSWFSLGKYKGANDLTERQWLEHLLLRRYLWNEVLSLQPNRTHTAHNDIREVLAALQQNPILDISSNPVSKGYLYKCGALALGENVQPFAPGVRLASVSDLYHSEELCLDDEERVEARTYFDWVFNNHHSQVKLKYQTWFDRPVDNIRDHVGGEILVRVNMLMPDTELINQFKQLLNVVRPPIKPSRPPRTENKFSFSSRTREPNIDHWSNSLVLPCLDVQLWGRSIGKRITNALLLDALFPQAQSESGGMIDEDNIRKTYRPIAKNAISWRNLSALYAVVIRQQGKESSR